MTQILRCDWVPERARGSYLARSGLPAVSRKKKFPESHTINPLLTKLVRSRWLDIGKKELGQYPAILTSHLVNNPYILTEQAGSIKELLSDRKIASSRHSFSLAVFRAALQLTERLEEAASRKNEVPLCVI